MWLCIYKRLPFQMVLTNPGSKGETGSRNPDYLARYPGGTIPSIHDPETGLDLSEAHAIMPYLCNKNGWTDVYPDAPDARAKVDWILHFHHRNLREASGLVAPKIRKDLDIPEAAQTRSRATLTAALQAMEDVWLSRGRFLAGDNVTIADFGAYVEVGQLQPRFTNLYDFSPFPNVQRWLNDMQATEGHDDVHEVLARLGDISEQAPDMDTIKSANKGALQALNAKLADIRG